MNILTSRQFNQDSSAAKKQSADGPVIITDRGTPAHVLMTYEHFQKLSGKRKTLAEAIAQDNGGDFDVDFPKLGNFGLKVPEFD
jgi:prevent-host-death family protein